VVTTIRKGGEEAEVSKAESLALKEIYNLLLKEVQIPTLQSIPLDTYQNIALILGNLKGQRHEGIKEKIRERTVVMMSTSVEILLEIRHHKILDQQHASSTIVTGFEYSKFTDEEKYILDGQKESDKRRMAVLAATLGGRPKVLESISAKIRSKQIVVRFIRPMERFIAVDMTKYGPFMKEDVAVLPYENARSFIEKGEAAEVEVA
jgi:DNA replication factor GINS